MRRILLAFALAGLLVASTASQAQSAEPSDWHSEQPVAAGIGVPAPLGEVGDIEFWAPNRGLLITGGNGGMPAGVYAYDGSGWYLYSSVCGGSHGRIAWAGPDDFWTISDQRAGEEAAGGNASQELENRSLCHFRNGEVVASYAEPIGQAGSYSKMNAAACVGPDDCWFGGELLPGNPNVGAFHLHWDGSALSAVPSLTVPEPGLADPGHAVSGMAAFGGQLYESVSVNSEDPVEGEAEPALVHRVNLEAAQPFEPVATPALPAGITPEGLEGLRFSSNGIELWALAGASATSAGESTGPSLLRLAGAGFEAVPMTGAVPPAGTAATGFAMEPGVTGAWVGLSAGKFVETARLAEIAPDGAVGEEVRLPQSGEELNQKGAAGPIACPAAGDCWMATSRGWLFHLGGPAPEGPNADPAMHTLIAFRPCDDACQSGPGVGLPADDSGAEPEPSLFAEVPEYPLVPGHALRPKPIYTNLHQKLIDHTVLQLSFILHARAHVQLIAKERKRVVAKTARMTLKKGPHRVRLRLDPKHWPTHLSFEVHPIKTKKKAS
jgi:hypothetical protein